MAYEVFKRTGVRVEEPALSLVPDGRIALNAAAVRVLTQAGVKSVLLLWDKGNNRVALKAAVKGDKNAYAVSIVRDSHSGSLRAKSFLGHIGWNAPKRTLLPATWNEREKMFEITLPQEHINLTTSPDAKRRAKTAL
jgi:hypothetical protein